MIETIFQKPCLYFPLKHCIEHQIWSHREQNDKSVDYCRAAFFSWVSLVLRLGLCETLLIEAPFCAGQTWHHKVCSFASHPWSFSTGAIAHITAAALFLTSPSIFSHFDVVVRLSLCLWLSFFSLFTDYLSSHLSTEVYVNRKYLMHLVNSGANEHTSKNK